MRKVLVASLTALFLLPLALLVGCGGGGKATIPEKTIELPKQGPVAAGAPGQGDAAKKPRQAAD